MGKVVLIVLSDKRSGSTMLQNALCTHPDIQTVKYSPHTYLETHHWLKGAVLLNYNKVLFSNSKVYSNYGSKINVRTYTIDLLKKNLKNYKIPVEDKELIFQGWEKLCEKYTKPIFFEKSPQFLAHWAALSLILEWMQQTKFNVKIIGLIRNPMAVQYSAFKLFRSIPNKRQYGWLNIYKNLLAFKTMIPRENYMEIQYEGLVDEPSKSLKKICEFVGINFKDDMAKKIHGNSLTKWIEDPYFDLQLSMPVKQIAYQFGYKEPDFINDKANKLSPFAIGAWRIKTFMIKTKNNIVNKLLMPLRLVNKKK